VHAPEGDASLTDIGITITPLSAAVIGMALLLALGLTFGLVLLVRGRWRRRRRADAMRAGVPSDDVANVPRGPTVRRAATPPLFAERTTAPDPMTARLSATTDPLEIIQALRSADADDGPAGPARPATPATPATPVPAPVPVPAPAAATRPTVLSPQSQAGVRGRSVDVPLVVTLIAGGMAVLLVARRRGRRTGG
jgi:hypothetical protein